MTTIFEKVAVALETLGVPFAQNTYLTASGEELPTEYLVYQLISAPAQQHADDEETLRTFRMQVSAYSTDGLTSLPDVDGAMKSAGFQKGPVRELPYDHDTGYFGLATDYIITLTAEELSEGS